MFLLQSWGSGLEEAKYLFSKPVNGWKVWFFIHSYFWKLLRTFFYVPEFKDTTMKEIEIIPALTQF